MTARVRHRAWLAMIAVLSLTTIGGCARTRGRVAAPPVPSAPMSPNALAARDWPAARDLAAEALLRRDFVSADSGLRTFAARHPGTPAAVETQYWRALVWLDPAAENAYSHDQAREARGALDAYLAGGPVREHYAEATTLRRVSAHLDSLHAAADAARLPLGTPAPRDSVRLRDDEMSRLRAELEQTRAELDRIRRRLSPPRP